MSDGTAAAADGGDERGITDRGTVVAKDRTGQDGSDGGDQQGWNFCSRCDLHGFDPDGYDQWHENRHGSPRGARAEGGQGGQDEDRNG